jgi:hypothetical protein
VKLRTWSWVMCFASLTNNSIVFGIAGCLSLFFTDWQKEFGSSKVDSRVKRMTSFW